MRDLVAFAAAGLAVFVVYRLIQSRQSVPSVLSKAPAKVASATPAGFASWSEEPGVPPPGWSPRPPNPDLVELLDWMQDNS